MSNANLKFSDFEFDMQLCFIEMLGCAPVQRVVLLNIALLCATADK